MKKLAAGAAMALLALGSNGAHATSTSSATLNGFTVTLVDLDPGDGIAPSIAWPATDLFGSLVRARADDSAGIFHQSEVVSPQPFAPGSLSQSTDVAQASASIAGSLPTGLSFLAQGSSLGSNADYGAVAEVGRDILGLSFTLSPHTQVVFSGSIDLFAQTTRSVAQGPLEFANATAVVTVFGSGGLAGSSFARSLSALCTQVQSTCVGQTLSQSAIPLSLTYTNVGASGAAGSLYVSLRIGGDSLPPVPEPATALMMLAGVAMLGARCRKA